jgi:hypothetical protein
MGAFYGNITLIGVSQAAVVAVLNGRDAAVSCQIGDYVVVFDWAFDVQDSAAIHELLYDLTSSLECSALMVLVHDDDVFVYACDHCGEEVDSYNSAPSYFDSESNQVLPPRGGDVESLGAIFPAIDHELSHTILHKRKYDFESERHRDLVQVLGLPMFTIGTSLETLKRGEEVIGLQRDKIIWTENVPVDVDEQTWLDKQFCQWVGPEDPLKLFRRPGCQRGAIKLGVLCIRHHFEMIKGRPFPFGD